MSQVEHHDVAAGPTFQVGDKPGPGIYRCIQAPEFVVHIEEEGGQLPSCDQCPPKAKATYRRVVDERSAIVDDQDVDPQ
jgi:hypothetical protein